MLKIAAPAILAAATLFSGCATYNRIADYPAPGKPVAVTVVSKPLSKMRDLPIGVYYDEPRQIVVSGHQKGLGWGMMFGLVGVMVADSANQSSAEKRFGTSTQSSNQDLGTILRELVDAEIAGGHAAGWSLAATPPAVELAPTAVFTVLKSGEARLYAMIRAEIPGASAGKPAWSVRYFARAPGEHRIEGDDGWMAGTRFADGMRVALQRALQVCREDTQGSLGVKRSLSAKGVFPYVNTDKLELPFLVVAEDSDAVVGRLAAGDVMVMAGTHVLERADYSFSEKREIRDPRP